MTAPGRLDDVRLVWHVDRAYLGSYLWDDLLSKEWEPFAVTVGEEGFLYHLRKLVPVLDADTWTPVGPTS